MCVSPKCGWRADFNFLSHAYLWARATRANVDGVAGLAFAGAASAAGIGDCCCCKDEKHCCCWRAV